MQNKNMWKEEVASKKSPDGKYMLSVIRCADNNNGLKVCKLQVENRLSRDTNILDFAEVPYSRRSELYWGVCSLLFVFYALEKSSSKEVLVIYDIVKEKYAEIRIGNTFNILTTAFPIFRKKIVKAKVKSSFSRLKWT